MLYHVCKRSLSNTDDKAKIFAVLEEQLAASNAEDLDRYMATIDPNAVGYALTKELVGFVMEQYDLNYELNEKKIIGYDDNVAYMYIVQTTTKLKGPIAEDVPLHYDILS